MDVESTLDRCDVEQLIKQVTDEKSEEIKELVFDAIVSAVADILRVV